MSEKTASSSLATAAVARRVDALFKAMASDFLLREQFVTDPLEIVFEYLQGSRPAAGTVSVNNQLLYAVMANPRLLRWLRGYVIKHHRKAPSRRQAISDFIRAISVPNGRHVVTALARIALEKETILAFEPAFLNYLFGPSNPFTGHGIGANTDGGPTTQTTDTGPTTQTTDTGPTTQTTDTGPTTQTTDTGPTTQTTDTGPTTQTTDTGPTTQTTDTGPTTQTTDTGPTTQTDQMPQFGGIFDRGYVAISLVALGQYAFSLQKIGALDATSSE